LALRFGYRESVDIDLFCHAGFSQEFLRQSLEESFRGISFTNVSGAGVFANYNGVRVDFVKHPQAWLKGYETLEKVRLASLEDISAMKINAIMGRGSKKDFSDLLFLHENGVPLIQSLGNFVKKYGKDLLFSAVRSLNYFEDAKGTFDPVYLNGWTWDYVEGRMTLFSKEVALRLAKGKEF